MTRDVKKILLGASLSVVILLSFIGLGVLPLNLFFLKATISEAVRDHTGAELAVEGPLRLQLGARPKLTARKVTLRWPDEARPLSASIEELSIQTRIASVLRGDIDLENLTADGIVIDPGTEELRDRLPKNLQLEASAPLNEALKAELQGLLANQTWALSLQGASLDTLLAAKQEYPLKAGLSLPGSGLDFDGVILLPWTAPGIDGQLALQSTDLSALLSQLRQDLPGLRELSLLADIQLTESFVQL
ncbi:MAG: AsmA family protein, partial [Xanthomonadales bacterium]|nr:AsmA family protein [Xanthomonadales bacterium]